MEREKVQQAFRNEPEKLKKYSEAVIEVLKNSGLTYRQIEVTFEYTLDRMKDVVRI